MSAIARMFPASVASFSKNNPFFGSSRPGGDIKSPVKIVANEHDANDYHIHCAYGGDLFTLSDKATGEHVHCYSKFMPEELAAGRPDLRLDNILPVCQSDNSRRGTKNLKEFLEEDEHRRPNLFRTLSELEPISKKTKFGDFNGKEYVGDMLKTISNEIQTPLKELRAEYEKFKKNPKGYTTDKFNNFTKAQEPVEIADEPIRKAHASTKIKHEWVQTRYNLRPRKY